MTLYPMTLNFVAKKFTFSKLLQKFNKHLSPTSLAIYIIWDAIHMKNKT